MSLRASLDGDDLFSPGGSAEPMRQRPPSPSPAIDFDAIDDTNALKALLKAREEKMRTLEKRIEIAQGAKNKLKERYSEKIDMLEQLVVALRRKLQLQVEEVKKLGGKAGEDATQLCSASLPHPNLWFFHKSLAQVQSRGLPHWQAPIRLWRFLKRIQQLLHSGGTSNGQH